jgi:methylglutaconyl-CoA hydratase
MRQPFGIPASALPKLSKLILTRRNYSSKSTPLINITDVQAPSSGRIRILSLARPSARNAISRQLLWELRSHVEAVAGEYGSNGDDIPPQKRFGGVAGMDQKGPTRALILASEVDSCFCAGADLKERAGFTSEEYVFISSSSNLSSDLNHWKIANCVAKTEPQSSSQTCATHSHLSPPFLYPLYPRSAL